MSWPFIYPYLIWTSPGGSVNNNSPTGGTTELPLEYLEKLLKSIYIKLNIKKRLKNENNIDIDKIILLKSVTKVRSKLSFGKKPPDEIIVRE